MFVPQTNQNRLLNMMPRSLGKFRSELKAVSLEYKMPLQVAHEPIEFVYFPLEGVASLVNTMRNGSAAEVGTIGNEGMVGLPIPLGDLTSPLDVYVQVPGKALRVTSGVLQKLLAENRVARELLLRYVHAFFNQVAQSAACNHFHDIEQRTCRWMLMTHDRVQAEQFTLTQEFLAMMLGVQRSSVSDAAQLLKNKKLIKYTRGTVTVLDRAGLERNSCECYGVSKREFDRLLGATGSAF